MTPHENTYTIALENYAPGRPQIRISFRFKKGQDPYIHTNCELINAKDLITGQIIPNKEFQTWQQDPQLTLHWAKAIELLKWSVKHDPDPVNPAIAAYIETV